MRINFVGSQLDGCYIYRCQNPAKYSQHKVVGDMDLKNQKWQMRPDITEADVVIFHRPKDERRLQIMKILKQKGVKVGFDNDDTWYLPPSHPLYGKMDTTYHEKCLQEADFVTTSTEFLAKEYRRDNENVYVIPNLIDFDQYPEPTNEMKEKKRVLITGSVLRTGDGFNFWNILKKLEKDVQLVIFGNYQDFHGLDAEYHEYVNPMDYPHKLNELNIDICLIPREENYFNRAKSNCKYLEMAACKIPVIAQSFSTKDSPYDLVAQEGAPIKLATNNWLDIIDEMTIEEREKMREDAYKWVNNYNANLNIFDKVICDWTSDAERIK